VERHDIVPRPLHLVPQRGETPRERAPDDGYNRGNPTSPLRNLPKVVTNLFAEKDARITRIAEERGLSLRDRKDREQAEGYFFAEVGDGCLATRATTGFAAAMRELGYAGGSGSRRPVRKRRRWSGPVAPSC
jgi:hypothetical protein